MSLSPPISGIPDAIYLGSHSLHANGGSNVGAIPYTGVTLRDGDQDAATAPIFPPPGWQECAMTAFFYQMSGGSGNIRFRVQVRNIPPGSADFSVQQEHFDTVAVGGTQYQMTPYLVGVPIALPQGAPTSITLLRVGADGQDTFDGDVRVHGILLTRALIGA